jgi:mannose-6-phosphate isomerase-like protein (cupin superfamily)
MAEQAKEQVDVIALARQSDDFRRVVITGDNIQVVVMTIQPGEEIGAETHEGHDQVLFFVDGEGEAVLDGVHSTVGAGDLSFVHAGVHHNFINTGSEPLRLVTAYAPPEHEPGTVHADKAEADAAEEEH